MKHWYAFCIKSQRQTDACNALYKVFRCRPCDVWIPRQAHMVRKSRRSRGRTLRWKPIPGYVFLRSDMPPQWYRISGNDVFIDFLRRGETIASIDEHQIAAIQSVLWNEARTQYRGGKPLPALRVGAPWTSPDGTMTGKVNQMLTPNTFEIMLQRAILGKDTVVVSAQEAA